MPNAPISQKHNAVLITIMSVLLGILLLAAEGNWYPPATEWVWRGVAVIGVLSTALGWGLPLRPKGGM